MKEYIQEFTKLALEGLGIGEKFKLINNKPFPIHNVLFIGLGGSGIGADIAINYLGPSLEVPSVVCKDYNIPGFVNENTLVIASSYSGNTEETITAVNSAKEKQAQIVCITSGGDLLAFAQANNYDTIILPSGIPPRACVPCSFSQILYVLNAYNLINLDFENEIKKAIVFLESEVENIKVLAKDLANKLFGKLPVIYTNEANLSVATRWRQQFNENSKVLGWERALPEMNHNELVGWRDSCHALAVIFLHSGNESERILQRFEINKAEIKNYVNDIIDVYAKGNTFFDKVLYLFLLGDWASWYLAELRKVDAVEVHVIDKLKAALTK